jgi:hypothetical protein
MPNAGIPIARTQPSWTIKPGPAAGSRPDLPASVAGSPAWAEIAGGDTAEIGIRADMANVNILAVAVAALSSLLIGGVWFSPILFAAAWQREAGLTDAQLRTGAGKAMASAFVLALIIALNLGMFLGRHAGIAWGAGAGALAGIGWATASLATVYLFERRSLILIVIDGGYLAVSYAVMGAIIGVWP